jgi:ubiquinone/menaquinone biosynthesis C-methylase UbiE
MAAPFRSASSLNLDQWETFYRGGALATGPAGADGLYDLEIREAWTQFFASLPAQARLLDVGTGNGVVALIAQDVARQRGAQWWVDATDLARIDPLRDVPDGMRRFAGITFHPGVATESLPFDGESFDAASGHYALEYCDTAKALAEIRRVLKPGADAQFILHHADSVLIRTARRAQADARLLLDELQLYRKLHRVVTMDGATPAGLQDATEALVAAIRELKAALAAAQREQPGAARMLAVALDAVPKLLDARRSKQPREAGAEVDRAEAEIRDGRARVEDLVAHALDEAGIARVADEAARAGFAQIERWPLHHAGANLIGWQLILHRP